MIKTSYNMATGSMTTEEVYTKLRLTRTPFKYSWRTDKHLQRLYSYAPHLPSQGDMRLRTQLDDIFIIRGELRRELARRREARGRLR
jgi:hypothetical protein